MRIKTVTVKVTRRRPRVKVLLTEAEASVLRSIAHVLSTSDSSVAMHIRQAFGRSSIGEATQARVKVLADKLWNGIGNGPSTD